MLTNLFSQKLTSFFQLDLIDIYLAMATSAGKGALVMNWYDCYIL